MTSTGEAEAALPVPRTAVRFAAVGVVNTLIDLVLYTVLVLSGLAVPIANFISTSAGMTFSFLVNRRFTFQATGGGRRHIVRQIALFFVVTGFGLWVIQPIVIAGAGLALDALSISIGALAVPATKLCGIAVALVWNYVLYSKVVFRKQPPVS